MNDASEKHARQQVRIAARDGYGATTGGRAIVRKWLPELTERLESILQADPRNARLADRPLLTLLREPNADNKKIDTEHVALCILLGALQSIGKNESYGDTASAIGDNIRMECLKAGLLKKDPTVPQRIEEYVKMAGPLKRRQNKARSRAELLGYKTDQWGEALCVQAGNWATNELINLLPEVFARDNDTGQEKYLTLTQEAAAHAEAYIEDLIRRDPAWAPETKPPRPWTGWNEGATWDPVRQQSLTIMRSWHEQTDEAVRRAIADGTMRPALDALNALQAVPWKINKPVLEVISECASRGITIKGLPYADVPIPAAKEGSDAEQVRVWKERARTARRRNRSNCSDRVMLAIDLKRAALLAEYPRFYTPMNFDWRGRINTLSHFNLQRGDCVRALFLFADGEPIGAEGLKWLKVHTANCGDFEKISKKPFDARIAWVDAHRKEIEQTATAPLEPQNIGWWSKASEPFQFLAACFELAAALSEGPVYVSHLPVSFDGSCSGLQHMCAMTRAPEGALVNLTPSKQPQDIYQTVAGLTLTQIRNDAEKKNAAYKHKWLTFDQQKGITRTTVKNNVMVYGYSGTREGMAKKQLKELVEPADDTAVLAGTIRPFGDAWQQRAGAARYMATQVYLAIEKVVAGPAQARNFLRKLSNAASKAGKPLCWTTPVGIPWINLYHIPRYRQIRLWLHDWPVPYTTKRTVGEDPKINKKKAANGAAPNFVHACDAAHLMLTVNAAAKEGITSIATVHDSFGCLAAHAERFRKIILEQFVQMYEEHDVLSEVLKQARKDLGETGRPPLLPELPKKGNLNIKDVLKAEYAFA